MPPTDPKPLLDELTRQIVATYAPDDRLQHIDATFLPNRDKIIGVLELLRRVVFPGFFDNVRITRDNVHDHTHQTLAKLHHELYEQIHQTLRYELNITEGNGAGDDCTNCDQQAADITAEFLLTIPELRRKLALDVQAAFTGDPAARSTDLAIFCYPGIDAIFIYRAAHDLHRLGVPLLARIMTEYAHNETGIDIHPGATIGESFFIDHGTGVVIGETSIIGRNVQVYQGVTLGALAPKDGEIWRGRKRHPTIEDDVTIYAGATILGGETVIGEGATIGGSVFLTQSVPAGHFVTMKDPEYKFRPPKKNWQPRSQREAAK